MQNITSNKPIDINKVMSVYSGIDGKCCCGCSGKHSYALAHMHVAGIDRGYAIDDDEVSDRSVKIIVSKINANLVDAEYAEGHVAVTVGTRLLVAYFVPSQESLDRRAAIKAEWAEKAAARTQDQFIAANI